MDRKLLIVFALTFLVIILSQPILKKYLPQPPAQPQQVAQPAPVTNASVAAAAPLPVVPNTAKQAASESETVVENDLYRITFTNRGAQVKSWILKKFDSDQGGPLDLVNKDSQSFGHPLALWVYDETLRNKINSALYVASAEGAQHAPSQVSFEYSDADVSVRKTFSFDRTYEIHVDTLVINKGSQVAAFPMWPAGFGDSTRANSYASSQIEYQNGGSVERLAVKKVSGGGTLPGPFSWAAVTDQYFTAVFIPENLQSLALVTLHNTINVPKDPQKPDPKETIQVPVLGAAVGTLVGPTSLRIYVGPKSLDALEAVSIPTITGASQDLRGIVNFGFFNIIARPLFQWLKWTHAHIVANWGWAIVVQTLIINIVLLPLRIYQMKSALKMQKIQPQIKAIQEKYKKYSMRDPKKQEMQKEIWDLQQREGVNMFGGCLPMLIQLPFLFAYYSMLNASIDLRHASWAWIHDLSAPDPYWLLPISMVISMLVMQRMTPTPGVDPAQQKMMMWMMPLFMGYIFFNLAAGLNLYYAESNLISVAQQLIMNRSSLGQQMKELAAKRARKKDK
ncbi:MAG TPA: membrane protein insertase YidC [Terriglobales bacterium]